MPQLTPGTPAHSRRAPQGGRMTRRRDLPPQFLTAPFNRAAAVQLGIPDDRLAASDLTKPFHGVRLTRTPSNLWWLCRAYLERMNPANCFSHATAAALLGVPLPLRIAHDRVHVATRAPSRAPEGVGVVGHQVDSALWRLAEVTATDPETGSEFCFPVLEAALVWAQLATVLDACDLIAAGDFLVGGDRPHTTIAELAEQVSIHRGRRGAKTMARALAEVRAGSLSRAESLLRLQLVRAGLPEPALNIPVRDSSGRFVAMPDVSWPEFRIAVEYEGDIHRTDQAKFRSDITRGEKYADVGWFQLRAHAGDVYRDPNPLIARIARRLVASGWRQPRHLRQVRGARP